MPVVTNTVKYPNGTVAAGRVTIDLVGTNGRPLTDGAWVSASDHAVHAGYSADLVAGVWSVNLTANELINPSGTRWRVTESVDGRQTVYYIEVPDGAGPYFAEDILDEAPGSLGSSALGSHAADTDAHGNAVNFTVQAEMAGMLPVGLDDVNDRVYAIRDVAVQTLFSSVDPALREWRTEHYFVGESQVGPIFVTADGAILAKAGTNIYRRAPGGTSWSVVLTDANMGATPRGICQTADGSIYIGQYATVVSYTANLWKSTDDGENWSVAKSWAAGTAGVIRHIHAVRADPYVANRIWIATGDADEQCFVSYSDDSGATFTNLLDGAELGQNARSVDILFTETDVIVGCDGNSIEEKVYRADRTTGALTAISPSAGNSLYYGGKDSTGKLLYASVYEPGVFVKSEANILAGNPDGPGLMRSVWSVPAIPEATRVGLTVYGPDSADNFYLGIAHTASPRGIYRMVRGKLEAAKATDKQLVVENRRPAASGPGYLAIGPHANVVGTSQNGATAFRVYLQKFRSDVDFLAWHLTVGFGATAGNYVAGFCTCADDGSADEIIYVSPSTALPAASAAAKLALGGPAFLPAGRDLWAFIQFDNAGTIFRSAAAVMTTSGLYRNVTSLGAFIDETTGTMPAQVASSLIIPMLASQT